MTKTITTQSEAETAAVGRDLAVTLSAGDTVLLYGDLGAGKTAFVRGLAEGLGVQPADVSSPTFTLVQEYGGGRVPLVHVDLYRLQDSREVDDLGLDEISAGAVMAIEWADRLRAELEHAIIVRLEHAGPDARNLTIQSPNHEIKQSPDPPITRPPDEESL